MSEPDGTTMLRRGARLLWRSVRTHPGPFSVALIGSALFATMSVGTTIVLGRVTDHVILPAFRRGTTRAAVLGSVAAILGVAVVRAVGVVMRRYFGAMTGYRMMSTWRESLVATYLSAPLAFHETRPTGELMAHADMDSEAASEALHPLPFSLAALLIAVVALVRLLTVDPLLALVAVALFPLLAVLNRVYTVRVEEPSARVQQRYGDVAAVTHESFDGALVVKTLGLERAEEARLAAAADRLRHQRLLVGRLRAGFDPAVDALPSLGTVGLLALGSWRVSTGAVTPGQMVEAMAMFGVLALPMRVLGYLLEELPRSVVSAERLDRVISAVEPSATSVAPPATMADGPLSVDVDGVSFGYEPGNPVIDAVRFSVSPGEILAIVGPTGAGKSTLCYVIAGLVEPWSGGVTLGGESLRRADPAAVRAAVAVVFQEAFLFADTVRENLVLGQPFSEGDVAWSTDVARVRRFIEHLPDRYDTKLGERGVTVSGGQRQRLALARALVRRPRLLLLDDATSAVDPRVEQQILAALRRELSTTTILVAHRVSTISLADRVLFLDGGRVRAVGTHHELLESQPGYEALVRAYEVDDRDIEPDADDEDDVDGGVAAVAVDGAAAARP